MDDVLGQGRGRWRVTQHSSEHRELVNGTRAEAPRLRKPAEWAGAAVAIDQVAPELFQCHSALPAPPGGSEEDPDPQQAP